MKRGFTLVELLVVITILLLITAATIPILAPGTETRRQREAARLLSTALSSAQMRAVTTGKPTGLWIEREASSAYSATVLYECEQPPTYTGDSLGAQAVIARQGHNADPTIPRAHLDGRAYLSGATREYIDVGDILEFAYQGERYRITAISANYDAQGRLAIDFANLKPDATARYVDAGRHAGADNLIETNDDRWGPNGIDDPPPGGDDDDYQGPDGNGGTSDDPPLHRRILTYQIYRGMRKSGSTPIRLPEGAVVDLRFSGLDGDFGGRFFGESNTNNPPGLQPWSAQGPLIVQFSPQGDLENVYSRGAPSLGTVPSSVHFLVGKRERIMDDNPTDRTDDLSDLLAEITSQFNGDVRNLPDERQLNFQDTENFWVTVQKGNGLATTSQVAAIEADQASVSTMTRPPDLNGDGQPDYPAGWLPANWEFITWINSTRRLARRSMVDGGQ